MTQNEAEERYHQALEGLPLTVAGCLLKVLREAVGLSMTGVERHGPISRSGLYHWEDGEPGISAFRYAVALARTAPPGRSVLMRATDALPNEINKIDPELEGIVGTVRELWADERNRNALRPIFQGLADLVT